MNWDKDYYKTIPSPQEMIYTKLYTDQAERMQNGGLFVEVGVYHGRSFAYFITEMVRLGKKFDCVAVDACPWEGEPCIGFNKYMKPLEGHFRTMFDRIDSFVAANNFKDFSIDFCFIDANHEYDFIFRDIAAYLPKMKDGGVIAGHDWSAPGVKKAVTETFKDFVFDESQDIWMVQL